MQLKWCACSFKCCMLHLSCAGGGGAGAQGTARTDAEAVNSVCVCVCTIHCIAQHRTNLRQRRRSTFFDRTVRRETPSLLSADDTGDGIEKSRPGWACSRVVVIVIINIIRGFSVCSRLVSEASRFAGNGARRRSAVDTLVEHRCSPGNRH